MTVGGNRYTYDIGLVFYFDDATGQLTGIANYFPETFIVDGATLDKDRDGVVRIFGTPTDEGWVNYYGDDEYFMTYEKGSYGFSFSMLSPNESGSFHVGFYAR